MVPSVNNRVRTLCLSTDQHDLALPNFLQSMMGAVRGQVGVATNPFCVLLANCLRRALWHCPGLLIGSTTSVPFQQGLAAYAGPGAYNDPDMLLVGLDGMYPYGIVQVLRDHLLWRPPKVRSRMYDSARKTHEIVMNIFEHEVHACGHLVLPS